MRVEGVSANKTSYFSVILEVSFHPSLPEFQLPLDIMAKRIILISLLQDF